MHLFLDKNKYKDIDNNNETLKNKNIHNLVIRKTNSIRQQRYVLKNFNEWKQAQLEKYGYDKDGYDVFGFNAIGYDREGYDEDGYNIDKFDKNGFDKDGYDVNKEKWSRIYVQSNQPSLYRWPS